jgi:alkylation response protein AidB-like acyl-CoA dehydrogenase
MLADMATKIEAARIMMQTVAHSIDHGEPNTRYLASISKCFSSGAAMSVTTDAVQVVGGYGYLKRHPVERMMRDAKTLQIFEGTNQIQRMLIARHLIQQR